MKNLKYFLGLLLVASIVSMVSCKDKDDEKKPDFTADYPEAQKVDGKITIFAKFEAMCENGGEIVLPGSYLKKLKEGSETEEEWDITDVSKLAKFVSAGVIDGKDWGAEGWLKVTLTIPVTAAIADKDAVLGAKPVYLKDGKFNWDYQIGEQDGVEVKSGDIDVQPGYGGECNIYFLSNATAAFIFKTWKNDPCKVRQKFNYTFNLTAPKDSEIGEEDKVYIAGGFENPYPNWSFMEVPKTADGKYSITLNNVMEDTEYAYVLNQNWDTKQADANCVGLNNLKTGTNATINDVIPNWKGVTCKIPGGTGTFKVTITSGYVEGSDIIFTGNFAEKPWGDSDRTMTKGADSKWAWTGEYPEGFEYKVIMRKAGVDKWAQEAGNVSFTGANFEAEFSFAE